MEFLKELLGDELFAQLEAKVNEHNGNEANKDKQIKIANLGSGEYVGKGKYDAEVTASQGKDAEIENYKKAIADLQKANKGNEDIQQRISQLETENAQLKAEQEENAKKYALQVALLSEKAVDVPYLTFKLNEKLKEKGETLTLDENGNIKGWDAYRDGLKTQFPTMFESANGSNMRVLGDNRLPEGGGNRESEPKDLAEALQQRYENQ